MKIKTGEQILRDMLEYKMQCEMRNFCPRDYGLKAVPDSKCNPLETCEECRRIAKSLLYECERYGVYVPVGEE